MKIYNFLARVAIAGKRYALKFFLVALPLVVLLLAQLVMFIMISKGVVRISLPVVITVSILLTICAAALALFLFNKLIDPLRLANQSLNDYAATQKIPDLPLKYNDEAGLLLANINSTIGRLDKLIVEKSDMVDLLSHDVRSPVGRILSLSTLIKMDGENEKDLYADYIANECTGLLSMLENILLILKEDNQVFRLEFVNLNKLIRETLSFFSFAAAEKNLVMNVSIDEHIYIPIQEQLFKQAIRNLVGNAIKFSPDGKSINISGKQSNDKIALSIRDEGLGFNPGDMKKIFERFTTAGKRGTHGEATTGLGLYLSKKIVEKHGGQLIAVSNGENTGALFTIELYRLVTKKPQDKIIKAPPRKSVMAFHRR